MIETIFLNLVQALIGLLCVSVIALPFYAIVLVVATASYNTIKPDNKNLKKV